MFSRCIRTHKWLSHFIIAWVTITMVVPPTAWATDPPPPQPPADDDGPPDCPPMGGGGESGCPENPPPPNEDPCPDCECPPCDDECPAPPPEPIDCEPEDPACTEDPIFLRHGTAFETEIDITLPGPSKAWIHQRTYNSDPDVLSDDTNQGNGWYNNQTEYKINSLNPGHTQLEVVLSATGLIAFELVGAQYVPGAPTDLALTHNDVTDEYKLTDERSGEVWIFHDFTVSSSSQRGKLKESTNRYWLAAGMTGLIYSYNGAGRISQITSAEGQDYNIIFSYVSTSLISSIEVQKNSSAFMKVEYTYLDSAVHSPDLGSAGDLVQVKTSRLASNGTDWIDRFIHYRYESGSRLKGIYRHDGIYSLIADNSNLNDPNDILAEDDDYSAGSSGSHEIQDFASRLYSYYTTNESTNSINTVFQTGENLESTYGGLNTNETGMVKLGIDRPDGCSSCGSGGSGSSGISYEYYYMEINHGTTLSWNDVVWLAIEDITDSSGTAVKRTVWGFNDSGQVLREAVIEDPTGAPKYWCISKVFSENNVGHLSQHRRRSAHTGVNTASKLKQFLDPTTGTNDLSTLNDNDGVIYTYTYDGEDRRNSSSIKNGKTGTAYLQKSTQYDSAADQGHPHKVFEYPTQNSADRYFTEYKYTFWDSPANTRMKTREIIAPEIGTDQNGSGVVSSFWEYYDEEGRLRWTKNNEGYVNYYSYSPVTGGLALKVVDVNTGSPNSNPSSLNSDITGNGTGKWVAWSGDVPTNLTRDAGLPTALELTTKREFDDQGRRTKTIEPGGVEHYMVYEQNRTITFPYWDSANGKSLRPIRVSVLNDTGTVSESYSVSAAYTSISTAAGAPTGFSTEPSQDDYVAWTRYGYDPLTGEQGSIISYHDIPTSGLGTLGTNYYTTDILHDAMGRSGATARYVSNNKFQVNVRIYDMLGRVVEARGGVDSSVPSTYAAALADNDFVTVQTAEFDDGGIGDSHVTSSRQYYGKGNSEYIETQFKRTYRGHLRGIEKKNGAATVKPYSVFDVDWQGRTVSSASYTWDTDDWSSVVAGDGYTSYASSNVTDRNNRTDTYFDDRGRVFRTDSYPGTEDANHLEQNNYYDRLGQLVCTGDKYSAHTEYAYDGAGREYQMRTVTDVASTKYSSGAFQYRAPAPHPDLASMSSTGDDGLIEFTHSVYDDYSNVTEQHSFQLNHTDTNGIDIDATDSFVRTTAYSWYDPDTNRVETVGNYGAGGPSTGTGSWEYNAIPTRESFANRPTTSADDVLVTNFEYNSQTGRLQRTQDPAGRWTRMAFDDLGRRIRVAENHKNYNPDTGAGLGGGTDDDEDRVTGWEYNGLGLVIRLTAFNPSTIAVDQITHYEYEDDYNASLVTRTTYPDGNETTDNVQRTYNLDGSLATMTDQRGVVHTYSYNDRRQLAADQVTSFGGSNADTLIESITRKYDSLGRLTHITSHGNSTNDPDNTTDIENQVVYGYQPTGVLDKVWQSHSGAATTIGGSQSPNVQYADDPSATGGIYNDGLRIHVVTYPNGNKVRYRRGGSNSWDNPDNIDDRLSRVTGLQFEIAGGTRTTHTEYKYNGTNRMVKADYVIPDVHREMFGSTATDYDRWDRFGRTITQQWEDYGGSGATADQFDYTYGYAGNRLTRQVSGASSLNQDYTYDGLHRLKTVDEDSSSTANDRHWKLDQLGNWEEVRLGITSGATLFQSRSHNDANELSTISNWVDPEHDNAGNMTRMPQPISAGLPIHHFDLTYDAWNRLVKVEDSVEVILTNQYDGLNRRIVRDGAEQRHFYYNQQWQVVEERVGTSTTSDKQYMYHPHYVDAVALMRNSSSSEYFYLQDANFNVTAVTDNTGAVVERYAYTPYGEATILNGASDPDGAEWSVDTGGSDILNEYLYTGRRLDPETGLQINRRRFYHAPLGRWVNRDPIGYEGSQWNLYEYVNGKPLVSVDPVGLASPVTWILNCNKIPSLTKAAHRKKCECICAIFPGEKSCIKKCEKCWKPPKSWLKDPAGACKCFCELSPHMTRSQKKICMSKCDKVGACFTAFLKKKDPKAYCKCVCSLMTNKKAFDACIKECNKCPTKPNIPVPGK